LNRREFLQLNLRLSALGLIPSAFLSACTRHGPESAPPAPRGSLLAPTHRLAANNAGTLFYHYDLDHDSLREAVLPLEFPHSAICHPALRNLALVPESGAGRCSVVDVREMRVTKILRAGEGRCFGGHGVFSPDGSRLFLSEFALPPSGAGFVSEWNGLTLERVRSFPSGGRFPHDVAMAADGRTLTVSNLGAETGPHVRSSGIFVARIDLSSARVLGHTEVDEAPGEVRIGPEIPGTWASEDPVMMTDASYFMSYMRIAVPQFRIFIYAHSHRKAVTIWNVDDKRLLREIHFDEQPRALTLMPSRKHTAIAFESGKLEVLDLLTYRVDPSLAPRRHFPVETHMISWSNFAGAPERAPTYG
jgi:hypothetical protein